MTATKADLDRVDNRLIARIDRVEARLDHLASKTDLADLRAELLKWVVGIVGFQTAAILGGVAALIHLLK